MRPVPTTSYSGIATNWTPHTPKVAEWAAKFGSNQVVLRIMGILPQNEYYTVTVPCADWLNSLAILIDRMLENLPNFVLQVEAHFADCDWNLFGIIRSGTPTFAACP